MTIAALATAPFRAAIGVIRMSGPEAFPIARRVLRYSAPSGTPALGESISSGTPALGASIPYGTPASGSSIPSGASIPSGDSARPAGVAPSGSSFPSGESACPTGVAPSGSSVPSGEDSSIGETASGSFGLIGEGQRRNLSFARIVDGDEVVDECVVCAFRGPYSYTGEDTVEFSCHGGVYLLDRVLRLLFAQGARQAEGGEFTKRAFLNGKSDLTRAEGVMDLIDAEYAAAAGFAMGELDGTVGRAIGEIRDGLLAIAAKLLAYVDYPDDEIGEVSTEEIRDLLDGSLGSVTALCDSYGTGRVLREGVKTVLCGRPNVGKSSLMNFISGTERSIVTDIAGTTRDTVEESVVFGGVKLIVTDTAGIRDTDDVVEQMGVLRARKEMEGAELIFCIFASPWTEEDGALAREALQCQGKTVFLFNKSDLAPEVPLPCWAQGVPSFRVSAKTGQGMDAVAQWLKEQFSLQGSAGKAVISNSRQYQCLCRVATALNRARENLSLTPDVLVSDLEEAIAAVGEITGETVSEQVIHQIFSRFCVGK